MNKLPLILTVLACCLLPVETMGRNIIVADSISRTPLPNASIYNRLGEAVGMSNQAGALPRIPSTDYPITIRYIGFNDKTVGAEVHDTIFLTENASELPEVVVASRRHRVLHLLAYVREYSTLSTYTDTVSLFREKMVDFMVPSDEKVRFKGWSRPRVLTSRSYYRFTNQNGLDSVSDTGRHHFSWSDWIGLVPATPLPAKLRNLKIGVDTIKGKYSPAEVWNKNKDSYSIDVDVLADKSCRRWVSDLDGFFRKNLDFEKLKVTYRFANALGDTLTSPDLTGYSFDIESQGRGHDMFRFNRINEPFFVSTQADVYVLDREYITVKEAGKWAKRQFDTDDIGIYEPMDAPPLPESTLALIDRVNHLDKNMARLDFVPDRRFVSKFSGRQNYKIGRRALTMLKNVTGITYFKSHKNANRKWDNLKKERTRRNHADK